MTMHEYISTFAPSAAVAEDQPTALIGDASEQTFTFYFAQHMKGHRVWSALVPGCFDGCARNYTHQTSPEFVACADECWRQGEAAHAQVRAAEC